MRHGLHAFTLAAMTLAGCDIEPTEHWVAATCIETIGCLAKPAGSDDWWVHVVADCELEAAIDEGKLIEVEPETGCTVDGDLMPVHRCFHSTRHDRTVCYAGDGVAWTQVLPECELEIDALPTKDAAPWEAITCAMGPCYGVSGSVAYLLRAESWVISQPPSAAPSCAI